MSLHHRHHEVQMNLLIAQIGKWSTQLNHCEIFQYTLISTMPCLTKIRQQKQTTFYIILYYIVFISYLLAFYSILFYLFILTYLLHKE